MSSIVIAGDTSGSVTLQAPAVAGSTVLNLPSTSGTIQTSGAGYTTNGVAYATSTSALSTGSALTYNGTTLTAVNNANTISINLSRTSATARDYALGIDGDGGFRLTDSTSSVVILSSLPSIAFLASQGELAFKYNSTTEGMRLTSVGLGIGTNSPTAKLQVNGSNAAVLITGTTNTSGMQLGVREDGQDVQILNNASTGAIRLYTNSTERVRVLSGGQVLVGSTTNVVNAGTTQLYVKTTGGDYAGYFETTNTSPYGTYIKYSGAAPNSTGFEFLVCSDTSATRIQLRSNGGIGNYSANNVNLSDARTKTDIQDAGGYLAKICAIPVRTFKYKDQTDDLLNLGCIAQEVEAVAPELIDASGFGETPEDGVPLKAIYQTDLQYALMKCIQEQQALINTLTDRISVLENK